jgi:hypothetical protein
MLSEMSSIEVSEWIAYFNVKSRKEQQRIDKNAEKAKQRAKENNH